MRRFRETDNEMSPSKARFHRQYKRLLKTVAEKMGMAPGTYDIRSMKGGPAVMGEVVLHGDHIYVMVIGDKLKRDEPAVMYRTVQGRRDYTGGQNHWMQSSLLNDPHHAASILRAYNVL